MGYDDDGQIPNTQYIVLDYKPVPIIFEVMGLPFRKGTESEPVYMQNRVGNIIHCEGGYLSEGTIYDKDGERIKHFPIQNGGPHTGYTGTFTAYSFRFSLLKTISAASPCLAAKKKSP